MRSLLVFSFLLLFPAVALAAGAPFETPPQPSVPLGPPSIEAPPAAPPVAAPPIDLELPSRPDHPSPPDLPIDVPQGPPDPLPSADAGIPDLTGVVDLPEQALDHVGEAPPFGGEHGNAHVVVVPEPATAALLVLGAFGLALHRRKR